MKAAYNYVVFVAFIAVCMANMVKRNAFEGNPDQMLQSNSDSNAKDSCPDIYNKTECLKRKEEETCYTDDSRVNCATTCETCGKACKDHTKWCKVKEILDELCTIKSGGFLLCPRGCNLCIDTDECASNPCMNGGTCTDLIIGYNCTCSPGWEGQDCNVKIVNEASLEARSYREKLDKVTLQN